MINKETVTTAGFITFIAAIFGAQLYLYSLFNPGFKLSSLLEPMVGILVVTGLYTLLYIKVARRQKRVLMIYHRNDEEFALALLDYLSANNIIVYKENKVVRIGDRIDKKLKRSIHSYDSFIVVLSKNLLHTDFLKKEIDLAKEKNKKVIPVIKDNTTIPSFLSEFKPADFKGGENGSLEFGQLLSAI